MLLAIAILIAASVAAYSNSFRGVFVFDDILSIPDNPTIRNLGQLGSVLSPPTNGETVSGRPLLNLSLAINYAISGRDVRGYHLTNLAIHILAALLLFGIVRRTLLLPSLVDRWGRASTELAFSVALIWAVHPLQTESITYIVQRAESMVALFYLLTLYGFLRGSQVASRSPSAALWYAVAMLACLLGMATKEVMVTAPLVVLLYDRALVAGSFGEALRRRWGFYVGLAATWMLLAQLVTATRLLERRSEFCATDPYSYARTQPGVILYYLRLCFWPEPLCLDYCWPVARTAEAIVPGLIAIGCLGIVTLMGLLRNRAWALVAAMFFLILAPTSSIVPLSDPAFEHRLYLASAVVLTLLILGAYAFGRQLIAHGMLSSRVATPLGLGLVLLISTVLGTLTYRRNADYQSGLRLWSDTALKAPGSARAESNWGRALFDENRAEQAVAHYRRSLALRPNHADTHNDLGTTLQSLGRFDEAIGEYLATLKLTPRSADTHSNLATILVNQGRIREAIAHFEQALDINPQSTEIHSNLGIVLAQVGKVDDAARHYQTALTIDPQCVAAHVNYGLLLDQQGKNAEAIAQFESALAVHELPGVHYCLARVMEREGRTADAVVHLQSALRLNPNDAEARDKLNALLREQLKHGKAASPHQP